MSCYCQLMTFFYYVLEQSNLSFRKEVSDIVKFIIENNENAQYSNDVAQKYCLLRVRFGADGGECEENDSLSPSVRHLVHFCNADFQRDFLFHFSQVFSGDCYPAGAVDAAEIGIFANFNGAWL